MNGATRQQSALPTTQRGAVVLLLLLIIAVSTAAYFLMKNLNSNAVNIERDKITAAALAQAKAALIGYAASDSNRPGELPCPDFNNDGEIIPADDYSGIKCKMLIGRLPWKTLRLPDLRDGYGERLWYALSDNFHATGSTTTPLNTTTIGLLSITGTSPANAIIAIVLSTGPVLGNQSRDSANINSVANYLEGDNANLDPIYETRSASGTFNDRLLVITYNDLFSLVTRRVAGEIGKRLASDYPNAFPSNLSFIQPVQGNNSDPRSWLSHQEWTDPAITTYTRISSTQATLVFTNCTGSYTIDFNSSKPTVSGHSC